jgi:hypothetical protein
LELQKSPGQLGGNHGVKSGRLGGMFYNEGTRRGHSGLSDEVIWSIQTLALRKIRSESSVIQDLLEKSLGPGMDASLKKSLGLSIFDDFSIVHEKNPLRGPAAKPISWVTMMLVIPQRSAPG